MRIVELTQDRPLAGTVSLLDVLAAYCGPFSAVSWSRSRVRVSARGACPSQPQRSQQSSMTTTTIGRSRRGLVEAKPVQLPVVPRRAKPTDRAPRSHGGRCSHVLPTGASATSPRENRRRGASSPESESESESAEENAASVRSDRPPLVLCSNGPHVSSALDLPYLSTKTSVTLRSVRRYGMLLPVLTTGPGVDPGLPETYAVWADTEFMTEYFEGRGHDPATRPGRSRPVQGIDRPEESGTLPLIARPAAPHSPV